MLTAQLLDNYPYSMYADAKSIQRGHAYYKDGRVWDVDFEEGYRAICMVEGDYGEYNVEIYVEQKSGELQFDCNCPYAEGHFCKHMIAAALEVSEHLKEELNNYDDEEIIGRVDQKLIPAQAANSWQYKLDGALEQLSQSASKSTANIQRYAAALIIYKEDYYYQGSYFITPTIIKAKNWEVLRGIPSDDRPAINNLLETNHDWINFSEEMYLQTNPAGCMNLTPEAVNLLFFLVQISRMFSGISSFIPYLPMLAQLQIPIFLASKNKKTVQARIHIHPQPVDIQVQFTNENGNLVLKAGVQTDVFHALSNKLELIYSNPVWLMLGENLFCLSGSTNISSLSSFPIIIPEQHADLFREKYLRRVAESLPIQSDLIQWREVNIDPIPRIYLHEDKDNKLRANLRFGYGEYEVPAAKAEIPHAIETVPGTWDLVRIQRQPEQEQIWAQPLADASYLLKKSDSNQPYGTFELRARAHPFDFLAHAIPKLAQAGYEIYGEENLKLGKINRATPSLRVNISSGIDWFDIKTIVEFGDQQISLHDVRKALKRGEHYIKLADGSVGQIPAEWLEKYKHLWNLAHETADGFRVNDFHLPLIDALLEDDHTIEAPADLNQRRERFRNFEQIASHPLPDGFRGELRPYQKHGFDWLHFLREYKFGGILADDMGLGKTVQVLAYIQSLREQYKNEPAVLLVVPKSLIANWQRESEKFTPGLRFMEYMGTFRNKDTAVFNDCDVLITTYGTMLRDVEILSKYRFHYVILDESQSIKNPLAKSARAARLLNAEYRLVMTGTPVENNTFELWSQFAFLNPGLLGNMDYFKREFATPIESGQDEESANTLRKLIYPFILRRTKEQVATELPPRTERIIYTDMDSAQKKLYTQTRERYRAELLGLIESDGMNDARFKILEGLLRLRQIAIHPGLVEKNYKGEVPKFEILFETLETLQAENHKALIFSQFVEMLKLVRLELDQRHMKYVYLDGQTSNRQARVDQFQNDASYPFFLISLKAGGVGLNLTAADYVIHLDPWWNPAVEMQASDRAHRIGQDKPVFIYKIIARDTVEEKILQLQERKRALVKSLITAESSFFKALTKDDVKMLFE